MAFLLWLFFHWIEPTVKVDEIYTDGISRPILTGISFLTSKVAFSVAEIFVVLTVLGLVILILQLVIALIKGDDRLTIVFRLTDRIAFLFIAFLIIWGFNYRAVGLESMLSLSPRQGTVAELTALARDLAADAAAQRKLTGLAEDRLFFYPGDLNEASLAAYDRLAGEYPALATPVGRAKPLKTSQLFSQLGISGIFMPYTAEANYNDHQPMLLIPSAVLHELAHLKGIAREEEANFMAFLASRSSGEPAFRYSAGMMALINTMNHLKKADPAAAGAIRQTYSKGMELDLADYHRYWQTYEGEIQQRAEEVNDRYLKANGQELGVRSYGEMVSFLLAWHKGKPAD